MRKPPPRVSRAWLVALLPPSDRIQIGTRVCTTAPKSGKKRFTLASSIHTHGTRKGTHCPFEIPIWSSTSTYLKMGTQPTTVGPLPWPVQKRVQTCCQQRRSYKTARRSKLAFSRASPTSRLIPLSPTLCLRHLLNFLYSIPFLHNHAAHLRPHPHLRYLCSLRWR